MFKTSLRQDIFLIHLKSVSGEKYAILSLAFWSALLRDTNPHLAAVFLKPPSA